MVREIKHKRTQKGTLPEDWEVKKLGDICQKINDKFEPRKSKDVLPYIGLEHIVSGGHKINGSGKSDETLSTKNLFSEGDILYGKLRPYLNKVWMADLNGVCSTEILVIRANGSIVQKLLYYIFQQERIVEFAKSNTEGTNLPRVNWKDLIQFKLALPTKKEQQKIAEILSTVDEAIENSDAIIKETQQLKKGLMQKLFTEGIEHKRFNKTKIGRVPEEWDIVQLGKLAEFKNGKAHEKNIVPNGEYIVVNSKFISTRGKIKKYSNDNLCPLFKGDIVMVMSDLPKGKALARCFYVPQSDKYTLNQRICSFNSTKVLNKFLYYFLNRNRYFLSFDNGVGQTNLRKDEVIGCPVVFPPLDEQHQITSILSEVDSKIENEQNTKVELEQLKNGLMQVLLTGKIRVKV